MKPDDAFFMDLAEKMATRSTCSKIHVGAVVTRDSQILGSGYNGVVSGAKHCSDCFTGPDHPSVLGEELFLAKHAKFSEENELHAEQNALLRAMRVGTNVDMGTVYCTWSPCFACAKVMVTVGIRRVVYRKEYKKEPLAFLTLNGVKVDQL